MSDEPKKGGEFPEEHQEAWSSGYFWGQRSIVNTLLDDAKKEIDELKESLKKTTEGAIRLMQSSLCDEHQNRVKTQSFAEFVAEHEGKCVLCAYRLISDIADAWKEQKAAIANKFPTGDFGEDDVRSERVSAARKRLEMALDVILTPEVKR